MSSQPEVKTIRNLPGDEQVRDRVGKHPAKVDVHNRAIDVRLRLDFLDRLVDSRDRAKHN